ncbi:MAG: peptidoglycan-binding domain-containing protein [Clostridia bacterium]
MGYYMGTPDGKFGAGLSDSVKRFKQDHQLGSTPVVDEATYEAMDSFLLNRVLRIGAESPA